MSSTKENLIRMKEFFLVESRWNWIHSAIKEYVMATTDAKDTKSSTFQDSMLPN